MCLSSPTRHRTPRNERGYIMMTLLLLVALMMIFTAAIVPTIKYEIEHDREEEMIHRGVQYSRAIRAYYKKFSTYPTKIEDLESANNMRFLRKRYKDPITGKDFKLLHYGDAALGGVMGGAMISGATSVAAMAAQNGPGGAAQSSSFGQSSFGQSSFGQSSFGQSSFGQSSMGQSSFGQSSFGQSSFGQSGSTLGSPPGGVGANPTSNAPTGQNSTTGATDSSTQVTNPPGVTSNDTGSDSTSVFGGGPIVGVASTSTKTGYREFNHKKKYSEWQFIYNPTADSGFLPMTPYQPPSLSQPQNVNGTSPNGLSGAGNGPGNGLSTGFGNGGMQNNPGVPTTSGFGNPSQPNQPNNPPEQTPQQPPQQ